MDSRGEREKLQKGRELSQNNMRKLRRKRVVNDLSHKNERKREAAKKGMRGHEGEDI